jgi:hypothetical protein
MYHGSIPVKDVEQDALHLNMSKEDIKCLRKWETAGERMFLPPSELDALFPFCFFNPHH